MSSPLYAPSTDPAGDARAGARARALAGLLVIGVSLALAFAQLAIPDLRAFVTQNQVSPGLRKVLLLVIPAGLVLAAGVIAWVWRRAPPGETTGRLDRTARFAAPLALAAVFPGLFAMAPWADTLMVALAIGAFVLAVEPLWRLHFSAYRPRIQREGAPAAPTSFLAQHWPNIVLGVAVVAYIAYMIFYTHRSHLKFNTYNWDLGQLDNEFYNDLHGRPFRSTPLMREGNWSELRNHAEFAIFALLPFYALHPAASTLLVLQSILLGLGAIPLYRFASRRLPRSLALVVTLAYFVYPPMHGAQFFDFHMQPVAVAFVLAAIDAFDCRRRRLFVLFWVLALACREDVSIGLTILGLLLVFSGYRRREGAVVAAVSAAYFIVMRFIVMPSVGAWGLSELYKDLVPPTGGGFGGVVMTLATNPLYTLRTLLTQEKLRYALQILAPVAFLPLRRGWLAVWLIHGAILTLLTTSYGPTLDIGYHYGADFVPYIWPAVALALATIGAGESGFVRRRAAVATLILGSYVATANWGAIPPHHSYHSSYGTISFDPPTPQERRRLQKLDEAMKLVPKGAILAASDRELSHVSNRIECWNLAVGTDGADYAIYTKIDPIPPDRVEVDKAKAAGWITIYDSPEIALLKRPGAR